MYNYFLCCCCCFCCWWLTHNKNTFSAFPSPLLRSAREQHLRDCLVLQARDALNCNHVGDGGGDDDATAAEESCISSAGAAFDAPINGAGSGETPPLTDVACAGAFPVTCNPAAPFRTLSGICNSLVNPLWGAASTKLRRFISADYADSRSVPRGGGGGSAGSASGHCHTGGNNSSPSTSWKCRGEKEALLPNPRKVSLALRKELVEDFREDRHDDRNGGGKAAPVLSALFVYFGMLMHYDLSLIPKASGTEDCCDGDPSDDQDLRQCFPIYLPCQEDGLQRNRKKRQMVNKWENGTRKGRFKLGAMLDSELNENVDRQEYFIDERWTKSHAVDHPRRHENQSESDTTNSTQEKLQSSRRKREASSGVCLDFARSMVFCGERSVSREQMNANSAFLDLSGIYGSVLGLGRELRLTHLGLMKMSNWGRNLPIKHGSSLVGDPRATLVPGLAALHTLFLREHNRVASEISDVCCDRNDELIFQRARRIVIAEMQNIAYGSYLPLLVGHHEWKAHHLSLDGPSAYNPTANPTIRNGFATAASRYGHLLVPPEVVLNSYSGDYETRPLRTTLHDEELHRKHNGRGVDYLLHGMMSQPTSTSRQVTRDLTDFLFADDLSRPKQDLVATSVQRGRDHGLPSYNDYRRFCGMEPICVWDQVPGEFTPAVWRKFKRIYDKPGDIDLYPAGLAETPLPGAVVGRTFACLLAKQFHNIRFGDRFFFTHWGPPPAPPHPFDRDQMENIRRRGLADVLCDNTKLLAVSADPFLLDDSALVTCGDHVRLDFRLFSDEYESTSKSTFTGCLPFLNFFFSFFHAYSLPHKGYLQS